MKIDSWSLSIFSASWREILYMGVSKSTRVRAAKPHSVYIGWQTLPSMARSLLFLVGRPST